MTQTTDPYQVLGVSDTATPEEIKQAYRRLITQHHPVSGSGDMDKFEAVNAAYLTLSTPQPTAFTEKARGKRQPTGGHSSSPPTPTSTKSREVFPLTINYSRTLAEMVAAGRYDVIYPAHCFTEVNFPIVRGETKVNSELFYLDFEASTKEILEELARQDLRPATLPEQLALGAQHPEVQRECLINELGSIWEHPADILNFCRIYGRPDYRHLDTVWISSSGWRWGSGSCFLAVPKYAK